jgi:hypothetical protein
LREAAMANATGESESDALRLDFDRRLTLQFARIWASIQFKRMSTIHASPGVIWRIPVE